MLDEPTHDGEGLAAAWRRLKTDLRHPFTRHHASRGRMGWRDVLGGHAVVNVAVEGARQYPQTFSKAWLWQTVVTLSLLAALAFWP
jgi:hypothetical protein